MSKDNRVSLSDRFKSVNKASKNNMITMMLVLVFFIVFNVMINSTGSESLIGVFPMICYYIILAISLNLVVGILGELSLGHAGFMCVGAFSSGVFSLMYAEAIPNLYVRFFLAVIVGTIFGAIFGAFIGSAVLRLRGDYLAVVTLAFGEVIKTLIGNLYLVYDNGALKASFITNTVTQNLSEDGIVLIKGAQGLDKLMRSYREFHKEDTFILLGMILVFIAVVIVLNFINSRSGRAVMSIRDNRIAAEATGINITKYRLMIYVLSSALAGMAGALYIHVLGSAEPLAFDYNLSIEILVIVVLGGIGSTRGAFIAAIILTWLPKSTLFMGLDKYRMLIYSIVLIVMMIFTWNPTCKELIQKLSIKRLFKKKAKGAEVTEE